MATIPLLARCYAGPINQGRRQRCTLLFYFPPRKRRVLSMFWKPRKPDSHCRFADGHVASFGMQDGMLAQGPNSSVLGILSSRRPSGAENELFLLCVCVCVTC